jgi:large subunit ribosomal protein L4
MASIQVKDVSGAASGTRELPEELFAAPINVPLMHQVVVAGAAAARAGTHSTKTRGDVRGGGVKPWRQKGTGRARQGSIRAPHWVGGGVAHGPHPHDHAMRVNKKMRKGALRSALSDALASGKVGVVDTLAFDEPKTKAATKVLAALELEGRVLIVLSRPNEHTEKSFRNVPRVLISYPGNLTTYDVLAADHVLFTQAALEVLSGEDPEAVETVVAVEIERKKESARSIPSTSRRRRRGAAEPAPAEATPESDDAKATVDAGDDGAAGESDASGKAAQASSTGQADDGPDDDAAGDTDEAGEDR